MSVRARMRTIVLGDLHLSTHAPKDVAKSLAALLANHRGDRVVFAGDFFDLSSESPRAPADRALEFGFEAHPQVARALAEHLEHGGQAVWVSGNHDPEICAGTVEFGAGARRIARALGVSASAADRVRVTPWFIREGGLHIEHGHLYDPDNAPSHPLASARSTLGVHFVEEFIAKTGAFAFLNANDATPLELFLSAFRWYGRRGPLVVYTYFHAAFAALGKSGRFYDSASEAMQAEAGLMAFLADAGIDEAAARALMAEHARPTMASMRDTVARLYLDRVTATLSMLAGLSAFALGRPRLGAVLGAAGLAGLSFSWSRGRDRYGGKVATRLDEGARRVARATGASLVVFGHAHEIADREGYSNTASFAFPRRAPGRPYLEIEGPADHPRAVRRFAT